MRFSCEKSILNDAISVCIHAVASKSSIPALEGLLITADTAVSMCGYNFKTAIQKNFDADITERGSAVINARIFSDIIRKLPDDIIEISVDDRLMTTIKCGVSEFNIMSTSAEEYPDLPSVDSDAGVRISNSMLRDMILRTSFAISDNENKPIHTGSLFEVEDEQLTIVSVDGYRLAIRKAECQNLRHSGFHFVVPGDTLRELSRILPEDDEPTTICPEQKHALFQFDNTVVTTRLLEGEFLNYRSAVPADQPVKLEIDVKTVIAAVERVSLIISERLKNPVRCLFDEHGLKLSCITALGRSYDEIELAPCPEPIEIGFNNRYLLDALRAVENDTCLLELKSGLSPCVLRPLEGDAFTYLVLPVRLKAGE